MAALDIKNRVKLLCGVTGTDKDELIDAVIDQARQEALTFCRMADDDAGRLDSVIADMAIYRYNRLGTEGAASEGYSGVSFSYTQEYPEQIMRQLKALRRVVLT